MYNVQIVHTREYLLWRCVNINHKRLRTNVISRRIF